MHGAGEPWTRPQVCFIAGFGRVAVFPQVKHAARLMETFTFGKIN